MKKVLIWSGVIAAIGVAYLVGAKHAERAMRIASGERLTPSFIDRLP